uniref:DUF4773 domain-containing protein n=1 Tax=Clastoptera arizonana TaxID=38151 RepID=A0A1B6D967_9HEMI
MTLWISKGKKLLFYTSLYLLFEEYFLKDDYVIIIARAEEFGYWRETTIRSDNLEKWKSKVNGIEQNYNACIGVIRGEVGSNSTEEFKMEKWSNTSSVIEDKKYIREDNRLCQCRTYRCTCCINFSFIKRWPAVGCFNIQSLPGYLNLIMSFSFNKRLLSSYPILGSNPSPFCKRLSIHHVYACLYVYDIHMYTKRDISLCLFMEVSQGIHPLFTIHLDCIRQFNHHLSLIPIRRPKRKGFVDIYISENDTAFTILKQVFHIPRRHKKRHKDFDYRYYNKTCLDKLWYVPKFVRKSFCHNRK